MYTPETGLIIFWKNDFFCFVLQLLHGGTKVRCCAGATMYDTGAAAPVMVPVEFIEQALFAGLTGHTAKALDAAIIIAAAVRVNIFFIMFFSFFCSGK